MPVARGPPSGAWLRGGDRGGGDRGRGDRGGGDRGGGGGGDGDGDGGGGGGGVGGRGDSGRGEGDSSGEGGESTVAHMRTVSIEVDFAQKGTSTDAVAATHGALPLLL